MLSVSGVAVTVGARTLFSDVSLRLAPGRRVALVGGNGAGKTTLAEVIVGLREPGRGTVSRTADLRLGWLPQDVVDDAADAPSVLEYVTAGATELVALERRLRTLEGQLEDADPATQAELLAAYGDDQERFRQLGGYELQSNAHRTLAGLGFAPDDAMRPPRELSGGWRVRAALARLLVARPDVLVLDEPTNHLDLDTIDWLADALRDLSGALLVVSHDRDFIDRVADTIVELAAGTTTEYDVRSGTTVAEAGGFASFVAQRDARLVQLRAARTQQDRQLAEVERFVERFRYKASKARQVQSRIRALDRVERIEVEDRRETVARFQFPEPQRSPRVVVALDGVTAGYGDRIVFDAIDLAIERGRTVALVGPNGTGKSTLLRLLAGSLAPLSGSVVWGSNVEVAVVDQHQVEVMDLSRTVIEEFRTALDGRHRGSNHRSMLGAFGFPGDLADRVVGELSGGERTRLGLAKAMASPVNLLLLDEPTNHLDLASRDVLEDAIEAYPGTVVLVTHDRHVIRSTADAVIDFGKAAPKWFDGTFEEFIASREPRSVSQDSAVPRGRPRGSGDTSRFRQREQATRADLRALRNRVTALERDLGSIEARIAELHRELADPAAYGDTDALARLGQAHHDAKDRAAVLLAEWTEAAEELERAEAAAADDAAGVR
ncbi:MAG: ABC-F family ATP-binding cassette domain-containing protein [Nitriliruptoraceae bacterium]